MITNVKLYKIICVCCCDYDNGLNNYHLKQKTVLILCKNSKYF